MAHGDRDRHGAVDPDDRADDPLRHSERRPDGAVRAGDPRLPRLLLRLHPHRDQLPPRAHRRHPGAAHGNARGPGRGGDGLPPRVRALRHPPGRDSPRLGPRERRDPRPGAPPGVLGWPGPADRRKPPPRLRRGRRRRPRRRQPRHLPLDVRPHGAPGRPVHPDRDRAPVPPVRRPLPHQHAAGDPPAPGRPDAPDVRRRRHAPDPHRGRGPGNGGVTDSTWPC